MIVDRLTLVITGERSGRGYEIARLKVEEAKLSSYRERQKSKL